MGREVGREEERREERDEREETEAREEAEERGEREERSPPAAASCLTDPSYANRDPTDAANQQLPPRRPPLPTPPTPPVHGGSRA